MRAPPARGVQVAAAQGAPAPARARAGALGRGGNAAMWLPGRRGSGPSFAGRSRWLVFFAWRSPGSVRGSERMIR